MTPSHVATPTPTPLSLRPARARQQLEDLLADGRWPGDVDSVVLAMHEALVNAQRHAGGAIAVDAVLDGSTLILEIYDRGPGFDLPPEPEAPEPLAERGRGLWLMCRISTRCEVRRQGDETCVHLRFDAA
ncbi:MAG: ATP-binding protein [Actinomycetota bacterium]|nr:ATP-binding protein [Actinomycetota bacterium]